MGRTVLPYSHVWEEERLRWQKFRRALRREDQAQFDRLFELARLHLQAGVYADGSLKVRGLACRRRDTPPFVRRAQEALLAKLTEAATPKDLAASAPRVGGDGGGLPPAPPGRQHPAPGPGDHPGAVAGGGGLQGGHAHRPGGEATCRPPASTCSRERRCATSTPNQRAAPRRPASRPRRFWNA